MERYMAHLLKGAEIRTQRFLDAREKSKTNPRYGGIKGDILEAKPTIYALTAAVSVYVNKQSRFYHDRELYEAINLALDFIGWVQREDGSFDFPSCNFKSAADTSFCFKRLIAAYRLLVTYDSGDIPEMSIVRDKYIDLMHRALEAICTGGFHTPNHRWAIVAALLQGAGLFREEAEFSKCLKERAEQYLAEGIDGDEDGEYAERSTGNYNAVVNNAMMAMYEETADDRFLGYVRRNLAMMLTYIDPDDTIFTQNSTRQDNGKQEFADKYFYQYLFMCSREHSPSFDGAAHQIICNNMERGDIAPDCLHIVMLHREMMEHSFEHYGFLKEYRKFYRNSGVLRVKKDKYTYTVLKDKSAFLYLKSGSTMINIKIGESYCDIRNFIPGNIRVEEGRCTLEAAANGWFYLPFEEPQSDPDWWKMDHSKREKLINSTLKITVTIDELDDGLELGIKAEGLDGLPLRLETCIPAGAVLEHDSFWTKAAAGEGLILKDGLLKIREDLKELEIGPGFGEHEFQGHYSGEEINHTGYTVYCNAYTPCERRFKLCVKG
ncbi:MAG: hypothetical protein ACRDBO_09205 [Lachnospiraceae bacterium]